LTNWYSVGEPVGWNAVAVGDLNYDGFADIVIQNRTTDEVGYANMSNGVFNNWTSVADPVGWNVVGAGDITNLGDADLVFQNRSSGQIIYGKMNNGALSNFVRKG